MLQVYYIGPRYIKENFASSQSILALQNCLCEGLYFTRRGRVKGGREGSFLFAGLQRHAEKEQVNPDKLAATMRLVEARQSLKSDSLRNNKSDSP